jgi:hypothetical protein
MLYSGIFFGGWEIVQVWKQTVQKKRVVSFNK